MLLRCSSEAPLRAPKEQRPPMEAGTFRSTSEPPRSGLPCFSLPKHEDVQSSGDERLPVFGWERTYMYVTVVSAHKDLHNMYTTLVVPT